MSFLLGAIKRRATELYKKRIEKILDELTEICRRKNITFYPPSRSSTRDLYEMICVFSFFGALLEVISKLDVPPDNTLSTLITDYPLISITTLYLGPESVTLKLCSSKIETSLVRQEQTRTVEVKIDNLVSLRKVSVYVWESSSISSLEVEKYPSVTLRKLKLVLEKYGFSGSLWQLLYKFRRTFLFLLKTNVETYKVFTRIENFIVDAEKTFVDTVFTPMDEQEYKRLQKILSLLESFGLNARNIKRALFGSAKLNLIVLEFLLNRVPVIEEANECYVMFDRDHNLFGIILRPRGSNKYVIHSLLRELSSLGAKAFIEGLHVVGVLDPVQKVVCWLDSDCKVFEIGEATISSDSYGYTVRITNRKRCEYAQDLIGDDAAAALAQELCKVTWKYVEEMLSQNDLAQRFMNFLKTLKGAWRKNYQQCLSSSS